MKDLIKTILLLLITTLSTLPLHADIDGTVVKVTYSDSTIMNDKVIDATDPSDMNPPMGNPINVTVDSDMSAMADEFEAVLVDGSINNPRFGLDIDDKMITIFPLEVDYGDSDVMVLIENMTWGPLEGKIDGISSPTDLTGSGISNLGLAITKDSVKISFKAGDGVSLGLLKVNYTVTHVPEPSTYLLLGSTAILAASIRRKKRVGQLREED